MKPHPFGTMQDKPGSSAQDTHSRLGLIGYPVAHSLSPALFREYFADRPDILGNYSYDLIERSSFDEARSVFMQDYAAVNVTAPFKENAFRSADLHDYSAMRCRASNLLVKTAMADGKQQVKAYNTDFQAVLDIIRKEYPVPSGHRALVAGCGGAGKAATAAALEAGMQTYICNRTISHASEFAEYLRTFDPHGCGTVLGTVAADCSAPALTALRKAVSQADLIIYTLPGGDGSSNGLLHLLASDPALLSGKTVLEANYKDPVLAGRQCRRYIPGLTWLRAQAVATYRTVIG